MALSIDALVAIVKRLRNYEIQHHTSSEDFSSHYPPQQLLDDVTFSEWFADYWHYIEIRAAIIQRLEDIEKEALD
ncbi:MAG: hypothetical protein DCF25_08040 [Leptolyngbya foveolarum]|uniref:Uncharacterized protein n=1 Tax=Leptolyngbya foveolarum TaxID=47253 RepID=A0A2W4UEM7_9CYAN|nr:MAG: hypothetical protein DCF25_08040 [Leptolyngbya foveolarum]